MATNESSGRWDATGSFQNAVDEQRELARNWANSLPLAVLHGNIVLMASSPEAFTLYERKALLDVVALRLGKELSNAAHSERDPSDGSRSWLVGGGGSADYP